MRTYFALLICLLNILPLAAETVTQSMTGEGRLGHPIPQRPPGFIELRSGPPVSLPPLTASSADPERLMAGHLLRRIGFGPNKTEMDAVLKMGIRPYIEMQLVPSSIDDSNALSKLPTNPPNFYADSIHMERWYTRMVYTKRLLQEKMTLILHEHFSVSNFKVGSGEFMNVHEDLLRKYALGNFRDLLIEITKDQAMLVFLDNNLNNGNAMVNGKRVPPNENYAREFLQLFALGPVRLNMDGTPVIGPNKQPRLNYTEKDVKEVARAFTGWYIQPRLNSSAIFWDSIHDSGRKTILGTTIPGRSGADGAREVDDVIDIVMKHPSMPPFISKILIQKLATETPTPQYIERVATVFKQSGGDLKSVVRAILIDPEFYSPAVVRTQFKEPIEHFVGALRALKAKTRGKALIYWTKAAQQLVYYPPSVFSFYPPGNKAALTNTAFVTIRDRVADDIVAGYADTSFNTHDLFPKRDSMKPEEITDQLADLMLAAPLEPQTREKIIQYFRGKVNDERVRGAIWLILCSPEYQRN